MSAGGTRRARREEALEELGRALKGTMAAARRLRGRDTQRPGELGFAQYHLLFGLHEHSELSTGDLAATAELTPATATQMLDVLDAMGLVTRRRSSADRRIVMCSLTEEGRRRITARRAELERRWREMLAGFSAEELSTAAAVVGRLRSFYDDLLADAPRPDAPERSVAAVAAAPRG
jgi:DNA-binding MarR family transcriptional regulator